MLSSTHIFQFFEHKVYLAAVKGTKYWQVCLAITGIHFPNILVAKILLHLCKSIFMHIFDKITFQKRFFNMDQPIKRMHQAQYKFHRQTMITAKIYSTVCWWLTCPSRYLSHVKKGNGFVPVMFLDIIDHTFAMQLISWFGVRNRRLVALARMSWLILAVWGFAPPA